MVFTTHRDRSCIGQYYKSAISRRRKKKREREPRPPKRAPLLKLGRSKEKECEKDGKTERLKKERGGEVKKRKKKEKFPSRKRVCCSDEPTWSFRQVVTGTTQQLFPTGGIIDERMHRLWVLTGIHQQFTTLLAKKVRSNWLYKK